MTSVPQLERILKHVLEERANALARETGFVKRERKLTGADFAQILLFGHLHTPQASLDQLTQAAQRASGADQQFGPASALHARGGKIFASGAFGIGGTGRDCASGSHCALQVVQAGHR